MRASNPFRTYKIAEIIGRYGPMVVLTALIGMIMHGSALAQENPYKDAPVNRAESKVIMDFNRFEFLESVLSAADGSIYTTSAMEGKLYRIKDGEVELLMDIDGILVCLAAIDDNNILITGTTGKQEQVVYQVDDKGNKNRSFIRSMTKEPTTLSPSFRRPST